PLDDGVVVHNNRGVMVVDLGHGLSQRMGQIEALAIPSSRKILCAALNAATVGDKAWAAYADKWSQGELFFLSLLNQLFQHGHQLAYRVVAAELLLFRMAPQFESPYLGFRQLP